MITLTKGDEPADLGGVTRLDVGISWDKSQQQKKGLLGRVKKAQGVDLDLIAILVQGEEPVRYAGIDNLDPMKDGSLIHTGDNTTGEGEGDDEVVQTHLDKLRPNITSVIFCAVAFKKGTTFEKANNVSFTVYDASDGKPGPVAEIMPSLLGGGNACAIAKAYREGQGWKFTVLNERGPVTQEDFVSLMRFGLNK